MSDGERTSLTLERKSHFRASWSFSNFLRLESSKGIVALTMMYKMIPSDQVSANLGLYGVPLTTSGAAYAADPQYV